MDCRCVAGVDAVIPCRPDGLCRYSKRACAHGVVVDSAAPLADDSHDASEEGGTREVN